MGVIELKYGPHAKKKQPIASHMQSTHLIVIQHFEMPLTFFYFLAAAAGELFFCLIQLETKLFAQEAIRFSRFSKLSAGYCRLLQVLLVSAGVCRFLQVSASFCRFLQVFAGFFRFL